MSRMALAAQRMEAQEAARLERERRDAAAVAEAQASELNDENARPLPNIHDFEGATLREKAIAMARAMNKGAGDEADDPEARAARAIAPRRPRCSAPWSAGARRCSFAGRPDRPGAGSWPTSRRWR